MTLIVCLDDRNGLMFNKRRQSKDAAVIADMLRYTMPDKITVSPYSAELFEQGSVLVSDSPLECAKVCFAESGDFSNVAPKVQRLVVYRWNRRYPADFIFPIDLFSKHLALCETVDFSGSSHEKITREVYCIR